MAEQKLIAGKYQLLRKIAQGGMAEVYLAKQTGLVGFEKLVVIKRILPHLVQNEEFVRMFLDEARTAADLRHPNVVQIFEIGEDQGTYFIAMEFLHGQDVRRVLRRQAEEDGDVPLPHALQIIIDAANGLDYAHKKQDLSGRPLNIIHRDISPQNIIVTYDGTTKIVDFGIAKAATQSVQTKSGVLKGKYSYMSPEQASGDQMDQRTDQFALGIVLYELTTMTRLFKYQNEIMTLHAIIEGQVKPPVEVKQGYPKRLSEIVLKSLAKRREDRFRDCRQLAEALEEFLAENRMLHSPARLSGYMHELFKEHIEQEKALGMPVIEQEGSGAGSQGPSNPGGDKPTSQSRRRNTSNPSASNPRVAAMSAAELQEAGTMVTQGDMPPPPPPATATRQRSVSTSRPAAVQPVSSSLEEFQAEQTQATMAGELSQTGARPMSRRNFALAAAGLVVMAALVGTATFMLLQPEAAGRVALRTQPKGAKVFVDGKELDQRSPLVIPNLEIGRAYALRVELPGYAPALRDVKITGEDTVELDLTLEKEKPGTVLRFRSTPAGAKVYLDGRPLDGVTPLELAGLPVDGEPHVATLSLEGYGDETRRFHFKEGVQDISVQLTAADAAEGKGRLNITSTPGGAAVTVDGKPAGNTPVSGVEVTGGKSHSVAVKLAGYESEERIVDVEKGATVEVAFEMEKDRPQEVGFLTLDSEPDTTVFTEKGRMLGKTPLKRARIPAGTQTLRLVNEKKGVEYFEKVRLETGEEMRRKVNVPKGRLKVVMKSWAHVYVNGVKLGTTPFPAKELYVGKHELRLVNDQLGKDERETIVVRANEDTRVKRDW
ncbi:MAG: serine/threonine-protein kinase [Myxococcota bacterium]